MAEMGSQFVAIYGAEPLTRPIGLPEVITEIYNAGMKATIITALPRSPLLKRLLKQTPLDSVTVSWDGVYGDMDREKKSDDGQHVLHELNFVRDRAVVSTVSSLNVDKIPEMAAYATAQGWWFLFDLYHPGMGQYSKCNDEGGLKEATATQLLRAVIALREQKQSKGLIHASLQYLDFLIAKCKALIDNGFQSSIEVRRFWHCHNKKTGWLTIDSDGSVMPCDDWQRKMPWKIWEEYLPIGSIVSQRDNLVANCFGCAWNTHFDAVGIEEGTIPITTYVH